MKNFKYFQLAVIVTLMFTAVSCTVTRNGYEGSPYENGSKYYESAPYANSRNYIILERDPFTGQYYQLNSGVSSSPYANDYLANFIIVCVHCK